MGGRWGVASLSLFCHQTAGVRRAFLPSSFSPFSPCFFILSLSLSPQLSRFLPHYFPMPSDTLYSLASPRSFVVSTLQGLPFASLNWSVCVSCPAVLFFTRRSFLHALSPHPVFNFINVFEQTDFHVFRFFSSYFHLAF